MPKVKSDKFSWGDLVVLNHPVKTSMLPSGNYLGAAASIPLLRPALLRKTQPLGGPDGQSTMNKGC